MNELQDGERYDNKDIEQLDSALVNSIIAMVLKLNDATFRPFFVQLVDQEGPLATQPQRAVTFYNFLAAFFDKLKVRTISW